MNKKTFYFGSLALIAIASLFMAFTQANKQSSERIEYMQFSTVESVVPGGLGRSRIITTKNGTSEIDEIKLQNFYSLVGINFGNIRHNDLLITDKITELSNLGWELTHVTSGVESGVEKTGLFITRYLFKRTVKM
jgi:hypothetical protein